MTGGGDPAILQRAWDVVVLSLMPAADTADYRRLRAAGDQNGRLRGEEAERLRWLADTYEGGVTTEAILPAERDILRRS